MQVLQKIFSYLVASFCLPSYNPTCLYELNGVGLLLISSFYFFPSGGICSQSSQYIYHTMWISKQPLLFTVIAFLNPSHNAWKHTSVFRELLGICKLAPLLLFLKPAQTSLYPKIKLAHKSMLK